MTTGGRIVDRRRTSYKIDNLVISPNVFGFVYYVDGTNGNDANTGRDPLDAFSTLAKARSSSLAGDTIVIAPGTYTVDVGTSSLAPKTDQLWMAAQPSHGGAPNVVITQDADDSANAAVAIDVDNVVFKDIEFKLVAGGTTALYTVDAAQTTAVRGLVFENCWFNLNSVDAAGVMSLRLNDATNAITGMVVRNCTFVGGDGTTGQINYIQVGIGGIVNSVIENNLFALESADGDCYGIHFLDPGASGKSYGNTIRSNDFIGATDGGEDSVGVFFASAMTEKEILSLIHSNFFAYCIATPVTVDSMNKGVVNNYVGDNATGGTLVDPGS